MLRTSKQLICLLALTLTVGCSSPAEQAPATSTSTKGLISEDVKVGEGNEATLGRHVLVHYTGWIYDESREQKRGREFDNSRTRNEPLPFRLGGGQVIRGWDEGVKGMKVGGRRLLTVPPEMAYGDKGLGDIIPPDATLIFDVELVDVQ